MLFDFSDYRRDFPSDFDFLSFKDLDKNPFQQARSWFEEVVKNKILDGNAMTLSTSDNEGGVSSRTVLLKYLDASGFVFFTNYDSRKAHDIQSNPRASALFYWPSLNKQLIISGGVEKLSHDESFNYFKSRPRKSRLLAWASSQDSEIESTQTVLDKMHATDKLFPDEIPLPPFWGGFRIVPNSFEFWQGGPNRINQRFKFIKGSASGWVTKQLSP